jgi:hypothetical protein
MSIKDKRWFKAIVKIAPGIATALGGPFGGLAATVLKEITGMDEAGIEKAIAEGDPNIFLQLKQAELAFDIKLKELDLRADELEYKDTADARAMRVSTQDWTPAVLTGIALTFFFALSYAVLNSLEIVQQNESFIMFLFGCASSWVTQGLNFFLGSSRGSQRKTDMLAAADPIK